MNARRYGLFCGLEDYYLLLLLSCNSMFQATKSSAASDSNDSNTTQTSYVPSDAEKELYRLKTQSLESSTKKLQNENRKLLQDLADSNEKIEHLQTELQRISHVNLKLTERMLSQSSVSGKYGSISVKFSQVHISNF